MRPKGFAWFAIGMLAMGAAVADFYEITKTESALIASMWVILVIKGYREFRA